MTGIEILATQEVVTKFIFNWTAFGIAFGIIFGILILTGILVSLYDGDWKNLLVGAICGLGFGLLFSPYFGAALRTPEAYETQYKVTISDEMPMNEFLEKYEIVDQEGKIYTIREK